MIITLIIVSSLALYLWGWAVHERLKAQHYKNLWESSDLSNSLRATYHKLQDTKDKLDMMRLERNRWREQWKSGSKKLPPELMDCLRRGES